MNKIILAIILVVLAIGAGNFLYQEYGENFMESLMGNPSRTMYIENLSISVTVAKTVEERNKGLSGTKELRELQGKLFVFDTEGDYGIWMKDMNYAIDIFWINNDFEIVYIEENVSPNTYPLVFSSPTPARFVLEMNAFFAQSFKIKVGDKVTLPPVDIPTDLKN